MSTHKVCWRKIGTVALENCLTLSAKVDHIPYDSVLQLLRIYKKESSCTCLIRDMSKVFPSSTSHNIKNLENTECTSTEEWMRTL